MHFNMCIIRSPCSMNTIYNMKLIAVTDNKAVDCSSCSDISIQRLHLRGGMYAYAHLDAYIKPGIKPHHR